MVEVVSKLTVAAGIMGVASLSFVGIGGYAAFTSNAELSASTLSGTFILNTTATDSGTSCINSSSNCFSFDAANLDTNAGTVNAVNNPAIVPGGQNSTITWSVPNMAPGDQYWSDITVQDWGTLQGEIAGVTYTPPAWSILSASQQALLSAMTVTVEEQDPEGNWHILPLSSADYGTDGSGSLAATGSYTFGTNVSGGNVPFLQPWGPNGNTKPGDEASATFRVIFGLSQTATNAAEGASVSPSLSIDGTTLP